MTGSGVSVPRILQQAPSGLSTHWLSTTTSSIAAYRAYLDGGGDPAAVIQHARAFYNELLILAAGIQLAGPNLTPETFAQGLASTTFPNPGAAGAPFFQATVGFDPAALAGGRDPVLGAALAWIDSHR